MQPKNRSSVLLATGFLLLLRITSVAQRNLVVYQTDFGTKDGAVATMKGVAMGVSPDLKLFDLTHDIPAYNIWEAAYRLVQTASYWPKGTVFVSVVDPGVGTDRKSVVLLTKSGHYFVTPDNGTLTLVAEQLGIQEVREINEATNRRQNSEASYTFHGRDVYSFTAARLASGTMNFSETGQKLPDQVVAISYQKATRKGNTVLGNVPILDVQYGNVWSNIDKQLFEQLKPAAGDIFNIVIRHKNIPIYSGKARYANTFGEVKKRENLLYLNSLLNVSLAINQGNFAEKYKIGSGSEWSIEISKVASSH
jgi:S-adenosylmethionine hydrolase